MPDRGTGRIVRIIGVPMDLEWAVGCRLERLPAIRIGGIACRESHLAWRLWPIAVGF